MLEPAEAWGHDESMQPAVSREGSVPVPAEPLNSTARPIDAAHPPTTTSSSAPKPDVNTLNVVLSSTFNGAPSNADAQRPPSVPPLDTKASSPQQSTTPNRGPRNPLRRPSQPDSGRRASIDDRPAAVSDAPEVVATHLPFDKASSQDGSATTEDRRIAASADELFLPYVTREQYIPLKVARDKLKQVLAEMAKIKSSHISVIDALERQHTTLKAQMEASVAAYVTKITKDYNARVQKLEGDYKARIATLKATAMQETKAELDARAQELNEKEAGIAEQVRMKESELVHERKLFDAKMEQDRKNLEALVKHASSSDISGFYEARIAELQKELAAVRSGGDNVSSDMKAKLDSAAARQEDLEETVNRLRKDVVRRSNEVLQLQDENASLKNTIAAMRKESDGQRLGALRPPSGNNLGSDFMYNPRRLPPAESFA